MSLEAIVDKCCTSLEALRQHPFSTVKGKTKHRRLKAAQKLLRSLLQDGDLELSMTHKGVVFLRGGSAAWHEDQEEKDPKTLEALRVLTMARTMKLSVRSMLKVPRACRRSGLMRVREMNTPSSWCEQKTNSCRGSAVLGPVILMERRRQRKGPTRPPRRFHSTGAVFAQVSGRTTGSQPQNHNVLV